MTVRTLKQPLHPISIGRRFRRAGLTLVEVMVSTAMIGVAVSTTMFALEQMNQNAAISRLQTGATAVAQNQVDQLFTVSPFNPQNSQVAPSLTVTTGTATPVTIYQDADPTSTVSVSGTMTTVVADISTTYNGYSLYEYRATVTVNYSYRNKTRSVSMSVLRASDT